MGDNATPGPRRDGRTRLNFSVNADGLGICRGHQGSKVGVTGHGLSFFPTEYASGGEKRGFCSAKHGEPPAAAPYRRCLPYPGTSWLESHGTGYFPIGGEMLYLCTTVPLTSVLRGSPRRLPGSPAFATADRTNSTLACSAPMRTRRYPGLPKIVPDL